MRGVSGNGKRRTFTKADLLYLANLCFDCRDCYYACQYAPPHEFAINVPSLMADLRTDTYHDFSWPRILVRGFKHDLPAITGITGAAILIILCAVIVFSGRWVLFAAHAGEGAFYRVIPYVAMTVPALVMAVYAFSVMLAGALRFWRETAAGSSGLLDFGAVRRATLDAFRLTYMKGGGAGCNYPDETFSTTRRWFHHLVFYGFLLDLASTTIAAVYDHFFGWQAPYSVSSWPVVLGIIGGIGLIAGTTGLLYLKWRSDHNPAGETMLNMDLAFLLLLFLTSFSGMLLLIFRETSAMGTLLAVHLATVAALFITAPYGKFAHVMYRYAALVLYASEQRRSVE